MINNHIKQPQLPLFLLRTAIFTNSYLKKLKFIKQLGRYEG